MLIKYNLHFKDLLKQNVRYYIHTTCLIIATAFLVKVIDSLTLPKAPYSGTVSAIIVAIFGILFMLYSLIYNFFKSGVLGEHTIEITLDYLRESTPANETSYQWKDIKRIYRSKSYIYIVINKRSLFLIPKRIFASEEECNRFTGLALEYYGAAIKNKESR